jgi:hypothetical protein
VELDEEITLKQILFETVTTEFAISHSKQKLSETALASFSNLLLMVGEFYRGELLTDEDLAIWFMHKHLTKVSLENLTTFSFLVSLKVFSRGDKNMMQLLGNLEAMISEATTNTCQSIKDDLDEIFEIVADI